MYKLKLSRREKKKLLKAKWLILSVVLAIIGFVVWLIWVLPAQREARINSFEECAATGHIIQESYPEVCVMKNGKRFVNTAQAQAHNSSTNDADLVPPSNPALLKLEIEEWGVQVPLTNQTFDLTYAYIEGGGDSYVLFTYKRLVRQDLCRGDIGLRLTRSPSEHQAPYSSTNPAPLAKVDNYYYYATYASSPCYSTKDPEAVGLVKKIAGDQSLTQATTSLLSKLTSIPQE